MYRAQIKYIVDVGLAVSFILCFITGVIKFPGFLRAIGATRVVLPMRDLTLIHDWSGILLGLLVLVHLVLNYRWIITMTRQIFGKKRMREAGE
jgi:cytochrome b subunit of formate dehydrogenase